MEVVQAGYCVVPPFCCEEFYLDKIPTRYSIPIEEVVDLANTCGGTRVEVVTTESNTMDRVRGPLH